MAVFPESMDRLDVTDTEGSFRCIENYIRYMNERVEFSTRNMSRNMSASGQSTTEILEMLNGLTSAMSAMQSTMNAIRATLTEMDETVSQIQTKQTEMEGNITGLQGSVASIEKRVAALEGGTEG